MRVTTIAQPFPASVNCDEHDPAVDTHAGKERAELRRAFDEAKGNTTQFNKNFQDLFERVAQTPTHINERESDMTKLHNTFLDHTLVCVAFSFEFT